MITCSSNVQTAARALPPQGDTDLNPANCEASDDAADMQASSHDATPEGAPQGGSGYPPLPFGAQALAAQAANPSTAASADAKGGAKAVGGASAAAPVAGAAENGSARKMVKVNLPGLGNTFLDSEMATKVNAWISSAHDKGVDLTFNSAYRDQEKQSSLKNDSKAITPADLSLHSAGLAVDVQYTSLKDVPKGLTGNKQRDIIRETAAEAGLKWGGDFTKKDPPHFYFEPAGDRQSLIDTAANQVKTLQKGNSQ